MKSFIVVDDELLVRVGLRSLADWEASGYALIGEAADGEEALSLVARLDPDIVVTDLVMPGMDGIELIRRLKASGSRAGVVVLSCRNDFESVREAMRLGADDYVFKLTLKAEELLEAFSRAQARISAGVAPSESGYAGGTAGMTFGRMDGAHRILALEATSTNSEPGSAFVDLFRELRRGEESVLGVLGRGERCVLAVANGGRPSLVAVFEKAADYASRYLGLPITGAYSSLALGADETEERIEEAENALSRRTFGPGCVLAFAEDPAPEGAFSPERYAAACRELSRAVDALDPDRCRTALGEVAESLGVPEEARRLRSLFSDALVPFGLRARSLGFDPDSLPGMPALDSVVGGARTAAEAADRAAAYAAAFIPFAAERSGLRRELVEVRRWALSDLRRDFTVEAAAAVAGMSPSRFAHLFKEEEGRSFIDWINGARMERAKELLLTTELLVRQVALEVGIENVAWFGTLFKRAMGVSPMELREGKARAE